MSGKITNRRITRQEDTFEGRNTEYYNGRKDVHNLGSGDSFYIANFLPKNRQQTFAKLLQQVQFEQMFYFARGGQEVEPIPRLVAAQTYKDGSQPSPIYRMPGCNEKNIPTSHWTETVKWIVDQAAEEINQPLNHAVITLFRDENDSLAFHTDKVLDLHDNSLILSISFGSVRPIVFQRSKSDKRGGPSHQTINLCPGSLLAIGPKTNKDYVHSIPKLDEPCGPRISLSIRYIDTFVDADNNTVSGKGSDYQDLNYPFVASHDDASAYSETVKEQMQRGKEWAAEQIAALQREYPLE